VTTQGPFLIPHFLISSSGTAVNLPPDIPSEAIPFLDQAGYLEPDRLGIGDAAPDVALLRPGRGEVRLSSYWTESPLVLIFGSYT